MKQCYRAAALGALLGALVGVPATPSDASAQARANPKRSPVLQAMKDELARSLETFKSQPTPPYYLSYEISEVHSVTVSASFGALRRSREQRRRSLDIDLRVGNYRFDNTHPLRGGFPGNAFSEEFGDLFAEIPVDDDPAAIRAALWFATDRRYKAAIQQLTWVKTNAAVGVEAEDPSPDFSAEPREAYVAPATGLVVDRQAWEDRVRRYTAPFERYGDIYEASASFVADNETRWFVNSEGTEIETSQPIYRLYLTAFSKADDGMELPRYESFWSFTPDGLPSDRTVLAAVTKMIDDLHALRRAPPLDPYTGPAILSGRAAAVFFHEVFGHRVEGHRQKLEIEGQTFKKQVNEPVLPAAFSVYFDPTLRRLGATDLAGFYRYDDEGVRARRVAVVEHGILKTFLMGRSPIAGFPASNGHGRAQPGRSPVARQSNLIVETSESHTPAELKRMLLDEVKRQGKPYGLLFDDIEGGFTITTRTIPNAFNVMPVMVYRIYPDGREELVRGVDLIGTPLTTFSKIVAADDHQEIFNGMCGAESGWVPVSAVSPGLLLSQIEVQKKLKSQERPPILPPPFDTGAGTTGNQ